MLILFNVDIVTASRIYRYEHETMKSITKILEKFKDKALEVRIKRNYYKYKQVFKGE